MSKREMDQATFDSHYRGRLERLSTTNLSDALDLGGGGGAVIGIRPKFECPRMVGRAVTIKVTAEPAKSGILIE
jgi:4-hydroxy-4-methyl-2-oxoglutarate aldolase